MLSRLLWISTIALLLSGCFNATRPTPVPTSRPDVRLTIVAVTLEASPKATGLPDTQTPELLPTRLSDCPAAPPIRLIVQERGHVKQTSDESLNLREGPSVRFEVIGRMKPGDTFMVIDGPTCDEAYAWFRVRFGDEVGWIAEGDFQEYYAEPYLPG